MGILYIDPLFTLTSAFQFPISRHDSENLLSKAFLKACYSLALPLEAYKHEHTPHFSCGYQKLTTYQLKKKDKSIQILTLTRTVMRLWGQIGQPLMQNPICLFYLIISLHFNLQSLCIIPIMDAWVVLLILCAEYEDLWVIHGLRQVLVTLHSGQEHSLVVVLFSLVYLHLINERVSITWYVSMHYYFFSYFYNIDLFYL